MQEALSGVLLRLIMVLRLQRGHLAVHAAATDQDVLEAEGGLLEGQGRLVQWYPGHIARAERRLQEQLSQVDAVLEVRDARCALLAILAHLWGGEPGRSNAARLLARLTPGISNLLTLCWHA